MYKNIPRISKINIDEIDIIIKMLKYIIRANVDCINYSNLSDNLKITKYKAQKYISYLEKAFIIKTICLKGINVLKEPKILLTPPYRLIENNYENSKRVLREDFTVFSFKLII